MWQPNRAQWRTIWILAVLVTTTWSPREGRSLAIKAINWAAEPEDGAMPPPDLQALPKSLPTFTGSDGKKYYEVPGMTPIAVEDLTPTWPPESTRSAIHRFRHRWAVREAFTDRDTDRQLLVGIVILGVLCLWRLSAAKSGRLS